MPSPPGQPTPDESPPNIAEDLYGGYGVEAGGYGYTGGQAVDRPVEELAWDPGPDPDPQAILEEAQADTRAGRYREALAKHVWYHRHALDIQPAQSGVRLSFALNYWKELADKYPPALVSLRKFRDAAGEQVLAAKNHFQAFMDFQAINRVLGDDARVVELFTRLHEDDPDKARSVYSLAEPALIRVKEYRLCDEYIHPDTDVPRIIEGFRRNRATEAQVGPDHQQFTEAKMTNESATLVALLAVNGRDAEAAAAAKELKEAWDSTDFHTAIDAALAGKVPVPWP